MSIACYTFVIHVSNVNARMKSKLTNGETLSLSNKCLNARLEWTVRDHYFTTVGWVSDSEVMISWLNRHQNVSVLSFCDAAAGTCKSVRLYNITTFSRKSFQCNFYFNVNKLERK